MSARPDDAPDEPILLREDGDGIAVLTLNRPRARNALSRALIARLSAELTAIAAQDVRVVILAGSPGPVFCAGHDLREVTALRANPDRGRIAFQDLLGSCAALMQAIVGLPQPVIAAVEGLATAAGCQLVATCDLAVAGEGASFCTPGVHIGLFCSTPMVALSRNVAPKHAMEMLLTGETVPAADALRMGLVNRVVPAGEALAQARALATVIASKSPAILRIGKRAFYEQAEMGLADAYAHAAAVMVENMLHRDAVEGIGAFVEKREPRWQG
ncbi:MAG: enoyl-CoA hydratase [Burkholderiales bacterium]|nr:enoyl-CoA hydratase [Burkholderiales bacterium]